MSATPESEPASQAFNGRQPLVNSAQRSSIARNYAVRFKFTKNKSFQLLTVLTGMVSAL